MNRYRAVKRYFVKSRSGWMVVLCGNKREARKQGVWEFGRGSVTEVRVATDAEIAEYERAKGPITSS